MVLVGPPILPVNRVEKTLAIKCNVRLFRCASDCTCVVQDVALRC